MQLLASDIGFGSTKNRTEGGVFKFPSAVAFKKSSHAEISTDDVFHYEGQNYLVGDLAVRDAMTTKDYSFLEKYAPLLLFKWGAIPSATRSRLNKLSYSINEIRPSMLLDEPTVMNKVADLTTREAH